MSDAARRSAPRTALAVREPPPPAKIARNLQVATSHDLLHVDGEGRVRSPARLRLLQVTSSAMLVATVAGSTALYYAALGGAGLVVGAVVGGWLVYSSRLGFVLRRGVRYVAADRYEEAAATFTDVIRAQAVPRRVRAMAEQNLALVLSLQGRQQESLALYRSAMSHW